MHQTNDRQPTFEQFAAVRRYQPSLSFSPDGSQIAYITNTSGQFNLWKQPSAGGYPEQLTSFTDDAVRDVRWSPDGATLLFTADHHGNEHYQLHLVAADNGWPQRLPGEPDVQHELADRDAWSPDGRYVAYCANDRDPTDQDVSIRNVETGEVRRLLAGDGYYVASGWSPDGRHLLCIKSLSNTDNDLLLVEVASGETRHLTPHDGQIQYTPGPWIPDGSGFYVITDQGHDHLGLAFFSIATNELSWVETPEWDIEEIALTPDGRILIWVVNEDGISRFHARERGSEQEMQLPAIPAGAITAMALAPDGSRLGFLLNTPRHPNEVYVLDLSTVALTRLTKGLLGGVPHTTMVEPELIRYETFDGKQTPAWLYRPIGGGPFGAVLSIHGGPEWQERPRYDPLYQYWVSRGIAVLAPNIRGSTGYGKAYQYLIQRDWGGGDLKDMEAAAQYLRSLPWVDRARIGVFGGSYGGFATLSCVTRLPDYWAAAVDIVGPSNLVTFCKSVPPTWRRFLTRWVGDPETDRDFLMERSPITYVNNVRCPLFVIQGANDPRVVQAESDQIVERLRARGVEVRYDVYEDEGHGFTKRSNELKALKDTAEFLETHLTRSVS